MHCELPWTWRIAHPRETAASRSHSAASLLPTPVSNFPPARRSFLQSKAYKAYKANGNKPVYREFGTPVEHESWVGALGELLRTIAGAMGLSKDGATDNPSVNVMPFDGKRAVAMTETVQGTYLFGMDDLSTQGRLVYNDQVPGDLITAHPMRDAQVRAGGRASF